MRLSTTQKVVLSLVGLIMIVVLGFVAYFYFALSGNPMTGWTEKQKCLTYYEKTYGVDFTVYASNYDYKRHDFEFKIGPTDQPEITFYTSVEDIEGSDGYGPRLVGYHLEKAAKSILEPLYGQLGLTINAYEQSDPHNKTETDPIKRLAQNEYSLFVRWEDYLVSREAADTIVATMSELITAKLAPSTMKLDFHVMISRKTSESFSYFMTIE